MADKGIKNSRRLNFTFAEKFSVIVQANLVIILKSGERVNLVVSQCIQVGDLGFRVQLIF